MLPTSFSHRDINYVEVAKSFEKEFENTLTDIQKDINRGQTELSGIFSIEEKEITSTRDNINNAVQSFITHSKTFDKLDSQIREPELAPIFVAKVLATGDAALLKDIPKDILEYGKEVLREWATAQRPYAVTRDPTSSQHA